MSRASLSSPLLPEDELYFEIEVLEALPNAAGVGTYPKGKTARKLGDNYVTMRLPGGKSLPHDPDAGPKNIGQACGLAFPPKLAAALELKRRLGDVTPGCGIVDAAQRLVNSVGRLLRECGPTSSLTCKSTSVPWAAAAGFTVGDSNSRPLPGGGSQLDSWAKRASVPVPDVVGCGSITRHTHVSPVTCNPHSWLPRGEHAYRAPRGRATHPRAAAGSPLPSTL